MRQRSGFALLLAAALAVSACGSPIGSSNTEAFCSGLAFSYPTMLDHVVAGDVNPDGVDASIKFLAKFYTDDFAAGAPDQEAGEVVVAGAKSALAGNLNEDDVAKYQAAFDQLKTEGATSCD